ncbi:MAG: penicillin acylase family protein, partial [Planctomycetota bacterium]|nr:penicillin acylase family protein [Planctomycetota bacterium]
MSLKLERKAGRCPVSEGRRTLLPAIILLAGILPGSILPAQEEASSKWDEIARSVTIYRDAWGVPHIFGPTDSSVVFGHLYAQAEDHFWQLEENFILATGRGAEVHGEKSLPEDILVRALEIRRLSIEEYERSSP